MREEDEGVSKSNRGGWHSKGNLFERDAPSIQTLRDAAKNAVFQITRKISDKVDPDELRLKLFAWMNANPSGGYNAPHTHPGAHWSGVYYVSQPEVDEGSSGMIEFLDPRNELPHWKIRCGAALCGALVEGNAANRANVQHVDQSLQHNAPTAVVRVGNSSERRPLASKPLAPDPVTVSVDFDQRWPFRGKRRCYRFSDFRQRGWPL